MAGPSELHMGLGGALKMKSMKMVTLTPKK